MPTYVIPGCNCCGGGGGNQPPGGCSGPFVRGSGGEWCGCECNCCPPPCCAVTWTFECGTPVADYASGCDCVLDAPEPEEEEDEEEPMELMAGPDGLPDFPDFDFAPISSPDGQFVFALGSTCSIPCQTLVVCVSTDACCIEYDGGGVYNVGSGNVCAYICGGGGAFSNDCECNVVNAPQPVAMLSEYDDCMGFTVYVNGEEGCAYVPDGGGVGVSLESGNGMCCPCCLVDGPTCPTASLMSRRRMLLQKRQQKINKGRRNGILTKRNAVPPIRLRITRAKPTFVPRTAYRRPDPP